MIIVNSAQPPSSLASFQLATQLITPQAPKWIVSQSAINIEVKLYNIPAAIFCSDYDCNFSDFLVGSHLGFPLNIHISANLIKILTRYWTLV